MSESYSIPGGKPKNTRVAPSQQYLEQVSDHLKERDELAVRLVARTGIPPRELKSLEWSDIEIQEESIKLSLDSRTIVIKKWERLTELLQRRQKENSEVVGSDSKVEYRLRKIQEELDVHPNVEINLQGFRWTAIINFFDRGFYLFQVLDILGRSSAGHLKHLQRKVVEETDQPPSKKKYSIQVRENV